jgi:hypothetical protein
MVQARDGRCPVTVDTVTISISPLVNGNVGTASGQATCHVHML